MTLDAGVVERFRNGEDEAVRLVYREYGKLVYAVALRVLGQRELAEEAAQQAFVQAWRALQVSRGPDPSDRGWPPSPAVPPSTSTDAKRADRLPTSTMSPPITVR